MSRISMYMVSSHVWEWCKQFDMHTIGRRKTLIISRNCGLKILHLAFKMCIGSVHDKAPHSLNKLGANLGTLSEDNHVNMHILQDQKYATIIRGRWKINPNLFYQNGPELLFKNTFASFNLKSSVPVTYININVFIY